MTPTTQYASQAMETGTNRPYEISFLVRSEGDVQGVGSLVAGDLGFCAIAGALNE